MHYLCKMRSLVAIPELEAHLTVNDCHIMKSWGPVISCSSDQVEVSRLIRASCSLLLSDPFPSGNFTGESEANEGCGSRRSFSISVISLAF